jgi:hypothetical protein
MREHRLVIPRFANAADGRRGAEVDADYESDDDRHPSARMSLLGRGMCAGYEACLQENLLIAAVTASGDGAQTYLARVHSFWRKHPGTRRPATIYVPLTPDTLPEDAVKKAPFISSFALTAVPTLKNVHQEAMKWLGDFNSARDELMQERAQQSIS